MSCEEISSLLDAYVVGDLGTADTGRVESHLSGCPGCSRKVEDERRLVRWLRSREVPPLPEGFARRVVGSLGAERSPRPPSGRPDRAANQPAHPVARGAGSSEGGPMRTGEICPNCQFVLGENSRKCDYCRVYQQGLASGTSRMSSRRTVALVGAMALVLGVAGAMAVRIAHPPRDATAPSIRSPVGRNASDLLKRRWEAPGWSPLQATGEPDTLGGGDRPSAWAAGEWTSGRDWLELEFDPPIHANRIRVFESLNPGAVVGLILRDPNGKALGSLAVDDKVRPGPAVLELPIPAYEEPVKSVKILLGLDRVSGRAAIDAVELQGQEGRGWAVDARASSFYTPAPPPDSDLFTGVNRRSYRFPSWSPMQATDAPDTRIAGDLSSAWAPLEQEKGLEWLELDYAPALVANQVRIRETYNPGAVTGVVLFDEQGNVLADIPVKDTSKQAPTFLDVGFPVTPRPVARVKVVLDTSLVPGWNEIDAVELVGPNARGWAAHARASSFYDSNSFDARSP
ncbi:MAG: zf-HC2 domain-containing protein, partial [Candidatus Riflebacteria bacterium]|nr:zf-HC2 domain-containing protein [Candidatus Riflebacteria bacterium]